jgi:hypothetical protein
VALFHFFVEAFRLQKLAVGGEFRHVVSREDLSAVKGSKGLRVNS